MLLCCFREPKKNKGKNSEDHDEDSVVIRAPQNGTAKRCGVGQRVSLTNSAAANDSAILGSGGGGVGSRRSSTSSGCRAPPLRDGAARREKERAPLMKDEKRMLKQRSHERRTSSSSSSGGGGHSAAAAAANAGGNFPYIDQSPVKIAVEELQREHVSGLRAMPVPFNTACPAYSPSTAASSSPAHNIEVPLRENRIGGGGGGGRGMTRSSASYGIQQLLQEQIHHEERQSAKKSDEAKYRDALEAARREVRGHFEASIEELKERHKLELQEVIQRHQDSINNAKNLTQSESRRHSLLMQKDYEEAEGAHRQEIERLREDFERSMKEKEERHRSKIREFQDRDNAWQQEKHDILSEIQRLKEEANRFIAILAKEEEDADENLSPARRQTLTREVDSLQLVVEMRTQELRRLREERARHMQQLEELEDTRNRLAKMQAKVEDLQAQLETKAKVERQLSLEKTNLENSFEAESRMKSRMTQQVEELQWKIKNKVEPPTKLVTTQAVIERPNSLMTTSNGNHGIRSKDWSRNGNANANASFKKYSSENGRTSINGGGNNNDSPADVPMPTAVVEPVRKLEDVGLIPKSMNNNPPPLSSKSVHSTPPPAHGRRILDLDYDEEDDDEDEDNLIIVNNQHFILADSKSAAKIIDTNANEDISAARPIIPDFIASSFSSDSDGEVNGAGAKAIIGIKGLDDGSIKCLSGDEGLGDISSNASSPNPPPQVFDDKPKVPQLDSPYDERTPSRIPLSVQTNL